jgi:hypothetical protein
LQIVPFSRIPVLDAEAAARVLATVLAERDAWLQPDARRDAHVLGCGSYLAFEPVAYQRHRRTVDALLRDRFSDLYASVGAALTDVLSEVHAGPLVFPPDRALPGFQILRVGDDLGDPRGIFGGAHWDWNFLNVDWSPPLPEAIDLSTVASFTLPISLPRAGSGLKVWGTLSSAEVAAYADEHGIKHWDAIAALLPAHHCELHPYRVGELVVHSGHLVHQVPPWERQAGDARITLQGHAIFHDRKWQIYW